MLRILVICHYFSGLLRRKSSWMFYYHQSARERYRGCVFITRNCARYLDVCLCYILNLIKSYEDNLYAEVYTTPRKEIEGGMSGRYINIWQTSLLLLLLYWFAHWKNVINLLLTMTTCARAMTKTPFDGVKNERILLRTHIITFEKFLTNIILSDDRRKKSLTKMICAQCNYYMTNNILIYKDKKKKKTTNSTRI